MLSDFFLFQCEPYDYVEDLVENMQVHLCVLFCFVLVTILLIRCHWKSQTSFFMTGMQRLQSQNFVYIILYNIIRYVVLVLIHTIFFFFELGLCIIFDSYILKKII